MSVRAAIVGVAGYTGAELARLLAGHPAIELAAAFGSDRHDGSASVADLVPSLRGIVDLPVQPASVDAVLASSPRLVFLATPHETSMTLAAELLDADDSLSVIDLSGAFRLLDTQTFATAYGFEHTRTDWLENAVYGLPEIDRTDLPDARLVACAGCYVTAASIPLHALIGSGVVDAAMPPIIDATSGVSGAGRAPKPNTSFCEVSQSPYGVFKHRHRPEIEQAVGSHVIFQPHLGPYDRGILATTHAKLAPVATAADVAAALHDAFSDEPFVRLLGDATTGSPLPSVSAVNRTNFIDLAWAVEDDHLTVFSAIDNLLKGASGQALQCANAVLGLDETLGLLPQQSAFPAAVGAPS